MNSHPLNRRRWLQTLAASTAAAPALVAGAPLPSPSSASDFPLPPRALLASDPETYWARIRDEQFLLPKSRIFLNNGSLGVTPRPVLKTITDTFTQGAEYATDDTVRWGYETLEAQRTEMAEFLGCAKDELAFTHNCTEAMHFIAGGLELKPGDEVLITNQEHPGGSGCWRHKAARFGISLREIEIPITPKSPSEIADRLLAAITPRTRVLSFSGITSPTGLKLPVRELCRAAREKGVLSVVDGAHMDGQIPVNLHELECDYFAGSPHKWMFAPAGSGILYGRNDALDKLWPVISASGWDNKAGLHAARFMMVGTNNRAIIDGMMAGLRFLKSLGEDSVYQRTHSLARAALKEAQKRPYLEPVTADDSRLFHALISIRFKSDQLDPLWKALKAANINILGGQRLRLAFHIHTRPSDIHRFFEVCDQVLG